MSQTTLPSTPNSAEDPAVPLSALDVPLARDRAAGLARLTGDIGRLFAKTTGRTHSGAAADASETELVEHYLDLLNEIDATHDELRQRMSRSESRNYEQGLQLKARSLESQTDALTQLANRRSFEQQIEERCCSSQATHCPLIVAILDIDHFKDINDTRGHHVGDAVLRGLAKIIKGQLPSGALAARFGGEEFVILISGMYLDQALEAIENMREHVCRGQFRHEGQDLSLTMSCGLAQLRPNEHRQQLLQRADLALYAAKQAGRNRSFWHDGHELHRATNQERTPGGNQESEVHETSRIVLDLSSRDDEPTLGENVAASLLSPRSMRANWCDGAGLFWFLRQRVSEFRRGGDSFCVLAIDVDNSSHIAKSFGQVALHFMMRAQMLHFDAVFRDMDVIARTCHSKVIVILPRTTVSELTPLLERLRETMDRFAYPSANGLLEYSISLGATEVAASDDAQQLVTRAESALEAAQAQGLKQFFAQDAQHVWNMNQP